MYFMNAWMDLSDVWKNKVFVYLYLLNACMSLSDTRLMLGTGPKFFSV